MKIRPAPFLICALLVCLGALVVQRHFYEQRLARQEQAITLAQRETETLRREAQADREAGMKRQATRAALTSAQAIAPRYDKLRNVSGYEPKKATPAKN